MINNGQEELTMTELDSGIYNNSLSNSLPSDFWENLDRDNNGLISAEEFCLAMGIMQHECEHDFKDGWNDEDPEESLRHKFEGWDLDNDGRISIDEL